MLNTHKKKIKEHYLFQKEISIIINFNAQIN